ncbi:MAG: peptidase T [Lachnospiraceae bacterium]|nr:peptidase T [Lachnospiraceae bacterium]
MSEVLERFLKYVKIDTASSEDAVDVFPSTKKQFDLAKVLVSELKELGIEAELDEKYGYVYASIPANTDKEQKAIGFIAHMDTSPAMSGTGVNPRIIEKYDGGDIVLNEDLSIVTEVKDFPELKEYMGKTLVVTDGTTLLGADDKAGVAEIMTIASFLMAHPEIKHGKICIAFTPDEEVGRGMDFFDVERFGADYAYTVDGGALGEISYENFNAAGAVLTVNGRSVHPGSAKGIMKNAILLAQEFQSMLPANERPECTEKYEGFYHLNGMSGSVEKAVCEYIIRDHDRALFEERKKVFLGIADKLNSKYGEKIFDVELKDSYYNMREIIEGHMDIVDRVFAAMKALDIKPEVDPIRGGTDGARLSFMGVPCPNLGTGGHNFHGKHEFVCVQSMEGAVKLLLKIAEGVH